MLPSRRVLDPLEQMSEILFGLIMVMTFTGSISVAESGQGQIRGTLLSALGCNLAWGVIDAGMYLMARFTERARGLVRLKAIRAAHDPGEAYQLIGEALPAELSSRLGAPQFETVRGWLRDLPDPAEYATFTREDLSGALAVFLLVFMSTLPVIVPFLVMHDAALALRTSHGTAVVMLFLVGWALGRHAGRPGWQIGLVMVFVGIALAALTLALGG
jgi:VIT1/CCC1 family predicted Fe2+/Mn2+ transporter